MNEHTDNQENEDVVVIEERDKRTHLYIIIAGVLGLALGGLVGSSLTAKKVGIDLSDFGAAIPNLG